MEMARRGESICNFFQILIKYISGVIIAYAANKQLSPQLALKTQHRLSDPSLNLRSRMPCVVFRHANRTLRLLGHARDV